MSEEKKIEILLKTIQELEAENKTLKAKCSIKDAQITTLRKRVRHAMMLARV